MRSQVRKWSAEINGTHSSVSLETEFYVELSKIAQQRALTMQQLIGYVAEHKTQKNLSSELRLTVLRELKRQISR